MAPERPLAPVQNRLIRPRYEDFSGWGLYFVRDIAGNQLNPYQTAGSRAKRSAPVGAGPIRPGGKGLWGPGGVWGGGGAGRRVPTWFGDLGGPKTKGVPLVRGVLEILLLLEGPPSLWKTSGFQTAAKNAYRRGNTTDRDGT